MASRGDWMQAGLDENGLALEIAPLDKPVLTRANWNVRYADHLDTAGLMHKYASHETVDKEAIQTVNYVVGAEGLAAAVGADRFSAVISSHVLEHVPNPIRWLLDIHAICTDGGAAVFAVPDRLRCFDSLRRPSVVADWLGAYLEDAWRPSPRNVIDALLGECSWHGQFTWEGEPSSEALRHNRQPALALEMARQAVASSDYYDVHCWVFQPGELFDIFHSLAVLDLFPFTFGGFRGTEGNEFLFRLVRDDASSWEERLGSLPLSRAGRAAALPEDFSVAAYLANNPDLVAARVDPITHWLEYGRHEGRRHA